MATKSDRATESQRPCQDAQPDAIVATPHTQCVGLAFLLVFVLLSAGIGTVGWFYYRNFAQHYRAEVRRRLGMEQERTEETKKGSRS